MIAANYSSKYRPLLLSGLALIVLPFGLRMLGLSLNTGTMVVAWVTQAMTPRTQPKQWKKGTGMQSRSFSVKLMRALE